MRHLVTQKLTMLGILVLNYWVKWEGGGVEKDEIQIFSSDFLFMNKVLKPVFIKGMLEGVWSVLNYTVLGLIFGYTALQPGLSEC